MCDKARHLLYHWELAYKSVLQPDSGLSLPVMHRMRRVSVPGRALATDPAEVVSRCLSTKAQVIYLIAAQPAPTACERSLHC